MGLLDKLNKLIVGSNLDDLKVVQTSLNRLKNITVTSDVSTFSELIRSIYTKTHPTHELQGKDLYTSMAQLLKDYGIQISDLKIEQDRIARYQEYDAIVRKIPYMKRALKVITQNVLNPEDYTKQAIRVYRAVGTETSDIDSQDVIINEIYEYIRAYEIEDFIYDIVYNTLKFGDYFVEILILPEVLKRYKLLQDSFQMPRIIETINLTLDDKQYEIPINIEPFSTKFLTEDERSPLDLRDLKLSKEDIYLNFLSPDNVVKLGDRFCLGYLVFKTYTKEKSLKGVNSTVERIINQNGVQSFVNRFMKQIREKNRFMQDLIKTEVDLKYTLARFLATYMGVESGNNPNQQGLLSIRFVPPELMEHFTIDRSEFKPYGTSIFYGSEFLSKIVIAIQASIMIQRLTRAIEKRVIRVDIGASRDSARYIEEVRRQFTRRRYTVDSIGTVDEIPSNLTTFEDIYIPMKNGRTPVEFDTLPPVGDLSTRVDDLKNLRDALVASTDVPPPYLGIEENTESKAQLTQENVVFAASVTSYQKSISKSLTSLFFKILNLVESDSKKLSDFRKFVLSFEPPTTIVLEHKADYMNSVSGIVDTLSNLGIPKKYLIEKLLPEFKDWSVESAKIEEDLEKAYKGEKSNEESEFGGGFGGGTFGGGETGGENL